MTWSGHSFAQLTVGDADHLAAAGRICSWYVHSARNADQVLRPGRIRLDPLPAPAGVTPADFPDRAAAFGWFDAEHDNLAATVAHGVRNGHGAIVWPLPLAGLAEIAWLRRDPARAELLYLQSLGTFEAIADHWGQADTLRALGEITADAAPARARNYWERARTRLEELGADEAANGITALLAALGSMRGRGDDGRVLLRPR
jgi:hypothetical protein